jgi:hypothetical protein
MASGGGSEDLQAVRTAASRDRSRLSFSSCRRPHSSCGTRKDGSPTRPFVLFVEDAVQVIGQLVQKFRAFHWLPSPLIAILAFLEVTVPTVPEAASAPAAASTSLPVRSTPAPPQFPRLKALPRPLVQTRSESPGGGPGSSYLKSLAIRPACTAAPDSDSNPQSRAEANRLPS